MTQWLAACEDARRVLPLDPYSLDPVPPSVPRPVRPIPVTARVLRGVQVVLAASMSAEAERTHWRCVVRASGAHLLPWSSVADATAVVCATTGDAPIALRRVSSVGAIVPVLSSEWVVQCLMAHTRLCPDAFLSLPGLQPTPRHTHDNHKM